MNVGEKRRVLREQPKRWEDKEERRNFKASIGEVMVVHEMGKQRNELDCFEGSYKSLNLEIK